MHIRGRYLVVLLPIIAACGANEHLSKNDAGTLPYTHRPSADAGGSADASGSLPVPDPTKGEKYGDLIENDFIETTAQPLSTFSIDVDTASYTIMRRDIQRGVLPDPKSVRIEEYINFFDYAYPEPTDPSATPFSINVEMAPSPFGDSAQLLRVALKGREVPPSERLAANLVFLIDVSGSMNAPNKLPLVKYALKQLIESLQPTDTLGIVVYAGQQGTLLPSTPVKDKAKIIAAIESLGAGGSTNGAAGIQAAYAMAEAAFKQNGVNRVILCTDGDFNVGLTGDALIKLIEAYRDKKVTLTTLGFGMGNLNDYLLEQLADKGNGNYAFIDSEQEADRVLVRKLVATLQVIAQDVKIQLELNASVVAQYRLVGYENRLLAPSDFKNDKKDAGEIGAGHTVTAFYELKLVNPAPTAGNVADVRLRFKAPGGTTSREVVQSFALTSARPTFDAASSDFRFAAAVVEFAEILRKSKHSSGARFDDVLTIAKATTANIAERAEFLTLVGKAQSLWK